MHETTRHDTLSDTSADLRLSIGGLVGHFRLIGAFHDLREEAPVRYAAFLLHSSLTKRLDDFSLSLRIILSPSKNEEQARSSAVSIPLLVVTSVDTIAIRRWDFEVRLTRDPNGRWTGDGFCHGNPYAFDSLARILWSILLPQQGGVLLHACGVRRDQQATIFPGKSGAGKTTLARKIADPDRVLSDEIIAVRRQDDGEWVAGGSPFWGELKRGGTSMECLPLSCLSFLRQGAGTAARPLGRHEATGRILECFLCFETSVDTVRQNLDLAARLASEVPCWELVTELATSEGALFQALDRRTGAPS